MVTRYDDAELLTSLWRLGAGEDTLLPTSHGILDRALSECRSTLPQALLKDLTFGVTNVGLRCYELPDILLAAQEALLTSEPNPTYLATVVTINEDRARQIALSHGLSTAEAKRIGAALSRCVSKIQSEIASDAGQQAAALVD